ncbi:MAG: hypothetical protein F6K41_04565 [Symploca sp. SIO3E6]|nr:hypothetical protein [Caldora sp. SIO3E6]
MKSSSLGASCLLSYFLYAIKNHCLVVLARSLFNKDIIFLTPLSIELSNERLFQGFNKNGTFH